MKRRDFLKGTGVAVVGGTVASPAIAQTRPTVNWRLTSSFPASLDSHHNCVLNFAKYINEATDGNFRIQTFAAGEVVPGLMALDAVSTGTIEACYTASYYYIGKDPTFALFGAIPFGLNTRQQTSWFYDNGGEKLFDKFLEPYNVVGLLGGNTGCQMGGWFRKELNSPADLNGLKMRVGGFAGQILAKLGVIAQQIAAGDIYPALEKGTIDACEWVGPYDDEKLGFVKVAPYYYYPGWWEPGTTNHFMIGANKWNELPKSYKEIARSAAARINSEKVAFYDANNAAALKRLVAAGAHIRPFNPEIMTACLKATKEVYAETSAKNATFKSTLENISAFRAASYQWWQVCELTMDTFMVRNLRQL